MKLQGYATGDFRVFSTKGAGIRCLADIAGRSAHLLSMHECSCSLP